ncbi:MAG: mechanosensitive ion channel [Flavobacterium sp.]|nr:MAG: mechanosensitive ion channel [Flavobacterium sp.]
MKYKPQPAQLLLLLLLLLVGTATFGQSNEPKKSSAKVSLFDDDSDSDYLLAVERAGETLESAYNDAETGNRLLRLSGEMDATKKKLDLILENLKMAGANVRNQQMYRSMLLDLEVELEEQNTKINVGNERLDKIKQRMAGIRKDTVFMKLIKDSVLRKQFRNELLGLKGNYKRTDSILKKNERELNAKKRSVVDRKMAASNALLTVENLLEKSGISLLGNEYPYLWDLSETPGKGIPGHIEEKMQTEGGIVLYYSSYTVGRFITLIFFISVLGWYIRRNLNYLRRTGRFEELSKLNFKYLNRNVVLSVLVVALNILVVTNLYAPALFIEMIQFFLLLILSFLFKNDWSKKAMRDWFFLIGIFVALCFVDLFIRISFLERASVIIINILAIRYALVQLKSVRDQLYVKAFFKWARIIFISFNAMALLFNLFGRVSLAHTLSLAGIIALTQIIALSVLLKVILEIILLQIYTTRTKRGIDRIFDHVSLSETLKKPFVLVISYMWLVVIASNLNIWEGLYRLFSKILTHPNKIGSFTFTLGGILLFFVIVWLAHLLQKYVAYFFGELDNEENEENINKRQHSKLLVTRLVVLIVGYLLAIAASGMPLDKISILLGALGVGVGLGLQNIVNNFVSGIILIFDRPIQVGDIIDVSSESGRVKSMGLRTTKLSAANGAEIIIPNGTILSQNITNWTYTDNFKLVEIAFTVNQEITPDKVNSIIIDTLQNVPLVNNDKIPQIFYNAMTDGNYKLLVKFWCSIYRTEEVISSAKQALFENFKKSDVSISL